MSMEEEIRQANIKLGNKLLAYEDLVEACQQVKGALLDAVHALNDLGEPAPASLGLAMNKVAQALAKTKS